MLFAVFIIALVTPDQAYWDPSRYLTTFPNKISPNHHFRRGIHVILPKKKCKCPPHEECIPEFKLDQDMLHFSNIQGLISDNDLKSYNNVTKNDSKKDKVKASILRSRRNSGTDDNCCCPPKMKMLPTFISDRMFAKLTETIKQNSFTNFTNKVF